MFFCLAGDGDQLVDNEAGNGVGGNDDHQADDGIDDDVLGLFDLAFILPTLHVENACVHDEDDEQDAHHRKNDVDQVADHRRQGRRGGSAAERVTDVA